ncbi:hypothetical protein [Lysinibacillus sp. BW-2-10]|uniref:hypothetical protein n=1 Tax=Lysinibacillus sp. BW-2-10 TaxID=2590030 RepID=UPI00117CE77F|nr:hypothetical protein [Lysinibacillus sp. BW-2-10]TSI09747.1 hypothetical protein FJQ64_05075 [Lysinibacillus sp. BW-2-10]
MTIKKMNDYLLTKMKKLSNATIKKLQPTTEEITSPVIRIGRTGGPRKRNESSKKQSLKAQLKDL